MKTFLVQVLLLLRQTLRVFVNYMLLGEGIHGYRQWWMFVNVQCLCSKCGTAECLPVWLSGCQLNRSPRE